MMATKTDHQTAPLPPGIYRDAYGYYVRVKVGSGQTAEKSQQRFDATATIEAMVAWQNRERQRLTKARDQKLSDNAPTGTLEADVAEYLAAPQQYSDETRQGRTYRLAWWCAQPAKRGAPVVHPDAFDPDTYEKRPGRLGLLPRARLDLKRVEEILDRAFAPTNKKTNPTEFANTSNQYRLALAHVFTVLDRYETDAVNPIHKIPIRAIPTAQPSGLDLRVVAEILRHVSSTFGRKSRLSELRLAVLAWVWITPGQLKRLTIADFHDVPDATPEDILNGAITVTVQPRFKGRQKRIPPPQVIPLNPRGVIAMRALAADPAAWYDDGREFSVSVLNRLIKRACARAQAALAKRGVTVDLGETTLYHLKHSLATATQLAAPGLLDAHGRPKIDPGLQTALGHRKPTTTTIYTEAAVSPLLVLANRNLTLYMDALFREPLKAATTPLRLVAGVPTER